MIAYLACGNIMSDNVIAADGSESGWHIGGPALFALSGARLYTENCKLVTRTGADYVDSYGKWMEDNGLTCESIRVECDHYTRHILDYQREDGGYNWRSVYGAQALGYIKTNPDDIDAAASTSVKGMYMAQNLDRVYWSKLEKIIEKNGIKMMWEIEYSDSIAYFRDPVQRIGEISNIASAWSINHNEASGLFNIPREKDEDIINEIMKLGFGFCLYRVGTRGAYGVTPSNAWFCPSFDPHGPSVDPTGCGNCSTGAAGWAWANGDDPIMTLVKANVASGYNAMQMGPVPVYTDEIMKEAALSCYDLYNKVSKGQATV